MMVIESEISPFILEQHVPFARSRLWQLQREYYLSKGMQAWRQGEVPHYITTNRALARSYAEMVFAFMRDQQQLLADHTSESTEDEPVYICELGGGSGRFAYHFLDAFVSLYEQSELKLPSFCYILTDFVEDTVAFWRSHPRLRHYADKGMLDFALFDVEHSDSLRLQSSGRHIMPDSLSKPLVVFANYIFDTVPQQLFYFSNDQFHDCPIALHVSEQPEQLPPAELLAKLHIVYESVTPPKPDYDDPILQALLDNYGRALEHETFLLFPEAALRCIQRLRLLSRTGLMLLSSDHGVHLLPQVQLDCPPPLSYHQSFSLLFNFHSLRAFTELHGGSALSPENLRLLYTHAFLLVPQAHQHTNTAQAYERHVAELGAEDVFHVSLHMAKTVEHMTLTGILAWLRLTHYESMTFLSCFTRLLELVGAWNDQERSAVATMLHHVWNVYYPIDDPSDIPSLIAQLFYEMDDYEQAYAYFEQSMAIYGEDTGTLYNMAACLRQLGQPGQARPLLELALAHDPDNEGARLMLDEVSRQASG